MIIMMIIMIIMIIMMIIMIIMMIIMIIITAPKGLFQHTYKFGHMFVIRAALPLLYLYHQQVYSSRVTHNYTHSGYFRYLYASFSSSPCLPINKQRRAGPLFAHDRAGLLFAQDISPQAFTPPIPPPATLSLSKYTCRKRQL